MSQAAGSPSSSRIEFPDNDKVRLLCGAHNENLKLVERRAEAPEKYARLCEEADQKREAKKGPFLERVTALLRKLLPVAESLGDLADQLEKLECNDMAGLTREPGVVRQFQRNSLLAKCVHPETDGACLQAGNSMQVGH